jgi:hypothetical protein
MSFRIVDLSELLHPVCVMLLGLYISEDLHFLHIFHLTLLVLFGQLENTNMIKPLVLDKLFGFCTLLCSHPNAV